MMSDDELYDIPNLIIVGIISFLLISGFILGFFVGTGRVVGVKDKGIITVVKDLNNEMNNIDSQETFTFVAEERLQEFIKWSKKIGWDIWCIKNEAANNWTCTYGNFNENWE